MKWKLDYQKKKEKNNNDRKKKPLTFCAPLVYLEISPINFSITPQPPPPLPRRLDAGTDQVGTSLNRSGSARDRWSRKITHKKSPDNFFSNEKKFIITPRSDNSFRQEYSVLSPCTHRTTGPYNFGSKVVRIAQNGSKQNVTAQHESPRFVRRARNGDRNRNR